MYGLINDIWTQYYYTQTYSYNIYTLITIIYIVYKFYLFKSRKRTTIGIFSANRCCIRITIVLNFVHVFLLRPMSIFFSKKSIYLSYSLINIIFIKYLSNILSNFYFMECKRFKTIIALLKKMFIFDLSLKFLLNKNNTKSRTRFSGEPCAGRMLPPFPNRYSRFAITCGCCLASRGRNEFGACSVRRPPVEHWGVKNRGCLWLSIVNSNRKSIARREIPHKMHLAEGIQGIQ